MADVQTPRIFLSHSRGGSPFVQAVGDELRRQGMDVRSAIETPESGGSWVDRVTDALGASQVVVVFIADAVENPNVYFEIGAALGAAKSIVPVYLTDVGRDNAPRIVSQLQGIDAWDLKPDEVANQIADAVDRPALT